MNQFYLMPADRIVVPKSSMDMVQHHVIYLGQNYADIGLIAENVYGKHIRLVTVADFFRENPTITRIEKFVGDNYRRRIAIERALDSLGKPYSLINFNCEHFANYVQYEKSESHQVGIVVGMLLVLGVTVALLNVNRISL